MTARIEIDQPPVSVTLRRNTRARRLTLRISNATGEVTLTMPPGVSHRAAERFLHKMSGWLSAKLDARPGPIVPRFGASILFRGKPHVLRQTDGRRVRESDGALALPGPEEHLPAQLRGYFKTSARDALATATGTYCAHLGCVSTGLTLRDTRSRWGSCTEAGRLMFSWRLIMAPTDVLNYVAAHEVAHLQEMNHGPAFWALVQKLMPEYRDHQHWLRQNGQELHRLQI